MLAASAAPALAQTGTTLASNTDHANGFVTRATVAQSFTTGSQDATIWEIKLGVGGGRGGISVKLRKDDTGEPGDLVAEFTPLPETISDLRVGLKSFTAPDDTTVDANTTYWVSVHEGTTRATRSIRLATNDQTGWSIGDGRKVRGYDGNWFDSRNSMVLEIRGTLGLTVTISGGSAVTEGGPAEFTVTANEAPSADLAVNLTVSESADSDFVATADEGSQTVTISAGDTTATYSVLTQADATHEPNGTVTVAVAPGTGYSVGRTNSADVTVIDDHDTAPSAPAAPTVSVGSSTSLSVSWSAPSDLGSASSITDYDLRYFAGTSDPANEADWIEEGETNGPPDPGSATSARITRLTAGTTYRVQVRALGDLESPWSASGSGVPMNRAPRLLEEAPQVGGVRSCRVKTDAGTPADQQDASVGTLVYAGPLATRGRNDTGEFPASCSNQSGFVAPFFDDPDGDTLTFSHRATVPDHVRFFQNTPKIAGSPPRLSFDGVTALRQTDFRVDLTATDPHGEAATTHALFRMPIAVGNTNGAPTFGDTVSSKNYVVNQEIAEIQLPAASGGDDYVRDGENVFGYFYEVTGLPAGLSFDAATRKITGTPTTVGGPTTVTYTADDADDETLASDTASLTFTITVVTTDTTAPTLSTVAVTDGSTLTLTFDEDLANPDDPEAASKALRFAFVIHGARYRNAPVSNVSPNRVTVSGPTVTLTLNAGITWSDHVRLYYRKEEAGARYSLKDAAGNEVASLDGERITNATPVAAAPEPVRATVEADQLTLIFDEALDENSRPAGSRFLVLDFTPDPPATIGGTGTARIQGTTVVVTLAEALGAGASPWVSYSKGDDANPLRGMSDPHHEVEEFRNWWAVSLDGEGPEAVAGSVSGASVTLYFDEALDTGSVPANGAFTVTVAGSSRDLSTNGVAVRGTAVFLTLASAAGATDAVAVTYAKPTGNPLKDTAGNDADGFTLSSLTNEGTATPSGKPALAAADPAVANGKVVTLAFDRPLDPENVPANAAFLLSLNKYSGVRGVTVRGSKVELRQGTPFLPCDSGVTVTYAKPGSNALRDRWGTEANGFSRQAVTNARADECSSGWMDEARMGSVILRARRPFAQDVQPRTEWFTVAASGGPVTVTGAAFSEDDPHELVLSLSRDLAEDETVTVSYTRPLGARGLWNIDGNQLADAEDVPVIGDTPAAAPSVEAVAVVSDPGAGATYAAGDTIRVQVTFGEAVTVDNAGGTPRLALDLDPADGGERWAAYESGSGEAALVFAYAAAAGDVSPGGVAVLGNTLELNGATIRSAAGADAALAHEGLDHDAAHRVDTAGPALSSATVSGSALTVVFDEALDAASVPPAHAFAVAVDAPGSARHRVVHGTGEVAVEGAQVRVTLAAPVVHGPPVTVAYRPFMEGAAGLRDVAGNEAAVFSGRPALNATPAVTGTVNGGRLVLTFARDLLPAQGPAPAGRAFTVRAVRPDGPPERTIAGTERVLVAGATVTVTLTEAVWPGDAVTVSYAPPEGIAGLRDLRGRKVAAFSGAPVANETPVPVPSVWKADVMQDAGPDGVWTEGETVTAMVVFTSSVRVELEGGRPTLALIAGGSVRRASYAGGTGAGLLFRYRVSEADGTMRAVRVAASGLKPNGGAIVSAADGMPALLGFGAAPGVTAVSIADEADVRWEAGDTVEVTLTFAEPVAVGGAPSVGLVLGGAERRAAYAGGSGGEALTFGYTLREDDGPWSRAVLVSNTLDAGAGSIVSAGGGLAARLAHPAASRTLEPSPAPPPSVSGVAVVSDAGGDATYALGDTIRVQVTFGEAVNVDTTGGTPRLKIKMDPRWGEFWAAYESGSGTASLTFTHTVAEPNTSPSGIAVLANTLAANGGAVRSAATGADAALGHAGLGHDPAHKVDWRRSPPSAVAPLTASFVGMPAEHDGTGVFTFELRFSEDFPGRLRYKLLRDEAFEVTNGRVRKAKRVAPGQNQRWSISVRPDSHEDVTVRLPAATDCAAPGAVCTEAGRKLSNTVSATVRGPALLSVADARAREGIDPAVVFPVTLSRAASGVVTVEYLTRDDTAKAGEDYERTRGTLTFDKGETAKSVPVPVLDDGHDEGEETFTLKLRNAQGAWLIDGEATGTIENSDKMPKAALARIGRTVAELTVESVEARLEAPRPGGAEATLGGQALPSWSGGTGAGLDEEAAARQETEHLARWLAGEDDGAPVDERGMTGRELLSTSAFSLTSAPEDGGPSAALWGRGASSRFSGREGPLSIDGEVTAATLGADFASGRWLAGAMVSHAMGEGSYSGDGGAGEFESALTGVYPYAAFDATERLTLWAAAGWGEGTFTLVPESPTTGEDDPAMETDMSLGMGALGAKGALVVPVQGAGGFSLDVKTDAFWVRTSSDRTDGLVAASADVTRLRLGLAGGYGVALAGGGSLEPGFELGLRHDGGGAETGWGVDVGGGVRWADPALGLSAELSARGLLAHEAAGFSDRGVSGSFAWSPQGSAGRGPSLTVTQTLGAQAAGGADALLGRETLAELAANDEGLKSRRLEVNLGYGYPAFGDRFTATPELGLGLADTGREVRLGWRLGLPRSGPASFEFGLGATRREAANDDAPPEHALRLDLKARF